ncbi:MAG: uridine diphosphate-N-acetylglucosamine-binding protein YvcK [Coriobacteriia bacterium]|nr:uridine diphosphate-N-acetylglucosamine-binding protein YvcK [Coriobacteriia bacterium]MCL2537349.1 uridine diphosphate-N-acetylglucosamine-binding protein YvcK [Coriobacteriia bacterium]
MSNSPLKKPKTGFEPATKQSEVAQTCSSVCESPCQLSDHKLVAIGGGTGLPLVLSAARSLGMAPTAVVSMADDGGSTGRLRRELGMLPPGDVRNCLTALASPEKAEFAHLVDYRFTEGEGISGHSLGNLMLAAATDDLDSFEQAVKLFEDMLDVQGRVLPSSFEPLVLHGFDLDGEEIYGQASLTCSTTAIATVEISPKNPAANQEAVDALRQADTIVIAPGSLFSSIVPNLLIPDIAAAIRDSSARVIYCCNVANMKGETANFTALDYITTLAHYGLEKRVNAVLLPYSMHDDEVVARLEADGIQVVVTALASAHNPQHHDEHKLASALPALTQTPCDHLGQEG